MGKENDQTYAPCRHPKGDGEFYFYNGENGTIIVSLRKGSKGLPIEEYLPESGKGDKFGDFHVISYISFAKTWLAPQKQWTKLNCFVKKHIPKGQRATVEMPSIDLILYQLLDKNNNVDYTKVKQLFSLIADLWEEHPNLSPVCGLIPKLFGQGLSINEIKQAIKILEQKGDVKANGELDLDRIQSDNKFQLMKAVVDSYNQFHQLSSETVADEAMQLWVQWTRSLPKTHPDFDKSTTINLDWRTLGMISEEGSVNMKRVKAIANFIWLHGDDKPSFSKVVSFIRKQQCG